MSLLMDAQLVKVFFSASTESLNDFQPTSAVLPSTAEYWNVKAMVRAHFISESHSMAQVCSYTATFMSRCLSPRLRAIG